MFRRPGLFEGGLDLDARVVALECVARVELLATGDLRILELVHLPVHGGEVFVHFGVELHQVFVLGYGLLLDPFFFLLCGALSFNTTIQSLLLVITHF